MVVRFIRSVFLFFFFWVCEFWIFCFLSLERPLNDGCVEWLFVYIPFNGIQMNERAHYRKLNVSTSVLARTLHALYFYSILTCIRMTIGCRIEQYFSERYLLNLLATQRLAKTKTKENNKPTIWALLPATSLHFCAEIFKFFLSSSTA